MDLLVWVVRKVTTADGGIGEAIQDKSLEEFCASPACERCTRYLAARDGLDISQADQQRERCRGARLLCILAAMKLGTEERVLEALRTMGVRGVDTLGLPTKKRYKMAGEARERPITSARYYVRGGHLTRMQQRLADELYDLITQTDLLETALAEHGEVAAGRHV
jgi:hypothetical protein